MSWQVASFAILVAVLIGGFAWYERSRPPSQTVALVGAMAALAIAGRVALAPIPNIVATTDIVLITGYALGGAPGFATGALAGLISNFWLGQGPWTPWQMAGWGMTGILGAFLAAVGGRGIGRLRLAAACGLAGLAYGALLNFSLMVTYGGEVSGERFAALSARALPFDIAHALGNVALALVAGPALVRTLLRFRRRFEVRWDRATPPARAAVPAVLLVALALSLPQAPQPAQAAGGPAAAARWLSAQQERDGGFAATPGGATSAAMTGWAILGLEAAGRNPLDVVTNGNSAIDYLRGNVQAIRSTGDLERTILALRGAGLDGRRFAGRDLVAELRDRRRDDGSYDGQVNLTAFGVMALRAASHGKGIRSSLRWLREHQNADGGWGFAPGAASDPDSTGAVLQALGRGAASTAGTSFLRRAQVAGGGFGLAGAGANAQSTAWAVQGLLAAGANPASLRRRGEDPFDYLASVQAADGHYRYSRSSDQTPVWVTAQALAALKRKTFPLAPVPRVLPRIRRRVVDRSAAPEAGGGGAARRRPKTAARDKATAVAPASPSGVRPVNSERPKLASKSDTEDASRVPLLGGLLTLGIVLGAYALHRGRPRADRH